MYKLLFIFSIYYLSGCGIFQKKENSANDNLHTVELHGTVYHPYCGGAKPSPDVEKGYYESMKFGSFKLFKGTVYNGENELVQVTDLDEAGNVTLQLADGDYLLMRSDKFLSIADFMKNNGPANEIHYVIKDQSCFKTWMNTPDLIFSVHTDTVIELRDKAKCWVGTNPCLEYIGPPAP